MRRLRQAPYDQARLFLRTLEHVGEPVLGPVLAELEHVGPRDVAELIAARLANGRETIDVDTFREHVSLAQLQLSRRCSTRARS